MFSLYICIASENSRLVWSTGRLLLFHALNEKELIELKSIVALNKFGEKNITQAESENVRRVLEFYKIRRSN